MNQKQRDYIISELRKVKSKKLEAIQKDCYLSAEDIIRENRGSEFHFDLKSTVNIKSIFRFDDALIKRVMNMDSAEIRDCGAYISICVNIIDVILNLPKKIAVENIYNGRAIDAIRDCVSENDFNKIFKDINNRKERVRKWYEVTERKVMLANNEEVIAVIENFEKKEF